MRQSKNFDRICFVLREAGIYDEKVVRSARLVQAKSGENSAEGFTFTRTPQQVAAGKLEGRLQIIF